MSAIHSDVQNDSTQTSQQPKPPVVSDRMAALEAITASRHAELEKETGVKIEPFTGTPSEDDDPSEAEAAAERARLEAAAQGGAQQTAGDEDDTQRQLQQEPQEQQASQAPAFDPKAKVKVKIDGVEQEVPFEDMLREFQKGRTADKRLEEAARQRRELEQKEREIAQRAAPQQNTQQPAATSEEGGAAQPAQGSQEPVSSAAAPASGATGTAQQPIQSVDPLEIAALVRQQIAIESVLAQSRADYPQLYADPDVEAVAASKISRLQAEGKPFAEALETVQAELATKFKWEKASQQRTSAAASDTSRRDEKLKRKEALDPPISTPNVKSGTTEEKPASVSDVIKEMAKARGQVI